MTVLFGRQCLLYISEQNNINMSMSACSRDVVALDVMS